MLKIEKKVKKILLNVPDELAEKLEVIATTNSATKSIQHAYRSCLEEGYNSLHTNNNPHVRRV